MHYGKGLKMAGFSQSLETSLQKSIDYAAKKNHEHVTVEHLLLALIDDIHSYRFLVFYLLVNLVLFNIYNVWIITIVIILSTVSNNKYKCISICVAGVTVL